MLCFFFYLVSVSRAWAEYMSIVAFFLGFFFFTELSCRSCCDDRYFYTDLGCFCFSRALLCFAGIFTFFFLPRQTQYKTANWFCCETAERSPNDFWIEFFTQINTPKVCERFSSVHKRKNTHTQCLPRENIVTWMCKRRAAPARHPDWWNSKLCLWQHCWTFPGTHTRNDWIQREREKKPTLSLNSTVFTRTNQTLNLLLLSLLIFSIFTPSEVCMAFLYIVSVRKSTRKRTYPKFTLRQLQSLRKTGDEKKNTDPVNGVFISKVILIAAVFFLVRLLVVLLLLFHFSIFGFVLRSFSK